MDNKEIVEKEGSKFGWGVLGFFFPIVGLILFLVWLNTKKKASKAAGIGALIGFIVEIVMTVLMLIFGLGILSLILEPNVKTVKLPPVVEEPVEEQNNNVCSVKATLGDKDYLYNYTYDESCESVEVLDESENVLFEIENEKIALDGVELSYPDKTFYKVDNSVILYSSVCSPGLCNSIYVYNISTNKAFKVETQNEILTPTPRAIEIDSNKDLIVTIRTNTSSGFEGMRDDPRVVLLGKIATCEITDIDAALTESSLENFALTETYTYKYSNEEITNEPTINVTETIKDYFHSYDTICNR